MFADPSKIRRSRDHQLLLQSAIGCCLLGVQEPVAHHEEHSARMDGMCY